MADYSKTTNFTAKDALPTGNPAKVIKGSEHDTEFNNISTAVATKANKIASATNNRIVTMDASGDIQDGGNATCSAGAITAASFTGPLTGNVTGDVTGSLDGTSVITDSVTAKTTNGDLALAGNGTGEVTIDGKTIGNATSEIPVNNGTENVNLNAEIHGGLKVAYGASATPSIVAASQGSVDVTPSGVTSVYGVMASVKGSGGATPAEIEAIFVTSDSQVGSFGGDQLSTITTFTAPSVGTVRFYVGNNDTVDQTFTVRYAIYYT